MLCDYVKNNVQKIIVRCIGFDKIVKLMYKGGKRQEMDIKESFFKKGKKKIVKI